MAAFEGLKRITEEYKELSDATGGAGTTAATKTSVPSPGIRTVRDYLLR